MKNNNLNLYLKYFWFIFVIVIIILILSFLFNITENKCKEYIVNHHSEIIKNNKYNDTFTIKKCDLKFGYYSDIGIQKIDDSTYYVIFWGNRSSILWPIYKDKNFLVDISYNRYKHKNIKKDLQILNFLND